MKKSPQTEKLEQMLRSSRLVADGFMGTDMRSLAEIIESDAAETARLGRTCDQIGLRMRQITDIATTGLGAWVDVDDKRRAMVNEAKGAIICPWPHPGKYAKRITILKLKTNDQTISFSDLNTHLIAEHGFFQGKNSRFRIKPKEIIEMIF